MQETPRILIIDDEERMLAMLEKVLTRRGYAVRTCSAGKEALRLLEEHPFDVVVTDLRMPDVNGMEILRTVKNLSPDTMVVMMTAFGSVDSAVEAMKAGAYDYLSKPFKIEELLLILERALEKWRLHKEVTSLRHEVWGRYQ
ncbi:MAG: sigma-54-dependent Fis family transcriptional regulator, partial [Nitrospinota bacterium]